MLAVIGSAFTWLLARDISVVSSTPSNPQMTKDTRTTSAGNVTSTNNYVNEEYRFSLMTPESWEGYTVRVGEGLIDVLGVEPVTVSFKLKQEDVLTIWVFDRQGWSTLTQEYGYTEEQDGGPLPTKIGENDMYVYSYSADNRASVKKVIDSFRSTI